MCLTKIKIAVQHVQTATQQTQNQSKSKENKANVYKQQLFRNMKEKNKPITKLLL